jgi:hypothetical protein
MATSAWTTGALHDSDANFRIWGKELSDKLQAMSGLTKTADTGQIDWTTVTRPGVSTDAGYEVYYLNDSLHATAPIYIKFYYGTHGGTTQPRIKVEVGTGTNGAGTLTGITATARIINAAAAGSATSFNSYLCVTTGFIGLVWKGAASFDGGFYVCRSCTTAGAADAKAAQFAAYQSSGSASAQTLRFEATAAAIAADTAGNLSVVPGNPTSSLVGADYQAYLVWMNAPDVRPVFGACVVIVSEFPRGTSFNATLIGSSPRTYLSAGDSFGNVANSTINFGLAIRWE